MLRFTVLSAFLEAAFGIHGFEANQRLAGDPPVFAHIPKNGGTWLERHLIDIDWKILRNRGCSSIPCSGRHVPIGLAIKEGCSDSSWQPGQKLFALLRHPYERAVSQWTWGHKYWTSEFGYSNSAAGMNRFIQDSVANASRPYTQECNTQIHNLQSLCGRFAQDCHWLPQSDFIFDAAYKERLVTTVLHTANLTAEFDELRRGFVRAGARARRLDAVADIMATEDGVPSDNHRGWLCALSEETKKLLDRHYELDFHFFPDLFDHRLPRSWLDRDGVKYQCGTARPLP